MLKGYYTLTSNMLTNSRNLNVISNNMGNSQTPGFKRDTMVSTTFKDTLIYRTGSVNKSSKTPLGQSSMINIIDDVVTNYSQGAIEPTERMYDVAILGNGFFTIEGGDGQNLYTRNGAFSLDQENYLYLPGFGRVMGENGYIQLPSDNFTIEPNGMVLQAGVPYDSIRLTDFDDYTALTKREGGTFSLGGATAQPFMGELKWQAIERSNVDATNEMVTMMTSQRALQSSSQILKMYDQLMGKIANELGRV